jgi:hypothetical protein|tara:strand:- start:25433 stop:25804 length:372 start_codon:yes stop_codon:yes gene_type:complete
VANRLAPIKKGIELFRDAGLTKVTDEGTEQFYIQNAEPDPLGKRVYCVVASNMSLNELVPMTPQEMTLVKIKYGDQLVIEDWTSTFNIHPGILEDMPDGIYGKGTSKQFTFNDIMQLGTHHCI